MPFVIDGNAKAFEELYERYSKKIHYFFYLRLYRNNQKAEDFSHDLFLKIIEKGHLYNQSRSFKVWLYSVASNMCKNEYRKTETREEITSNLFSEEYREHYEPRFDERFDQKQFADKLSLALDDLEEYHSLTFILRYKEHLSIKEISEVMNCSEGTVKSRIFYSIKKLSAKLNSYNPYKAVNS